MLSPEENINPQRRQEFLFWLCAYAAVLVFLGRNSLFGAEALVAEAAREIAVSHQWSTVRINFAPFPGLHPLNVCSVALLYLGIGVSEFSTRIIAAATALLLFSGVRRLAVLLFDRRTALVAGWLTLGTSSALYLGRRAGDCIPACAAVIWAVAWYLGTPRRMSFRRALIFYLLLFFAAVLYGNWCLLPLGFLLPWWISEKSFRGALSWKGVSALLLVGVFGFLWWVNADGAVTIEAWRSAPAAAARALLAAIGESYLDKGWRFLYLSLPDVVRVLLPWPLLALAAAITAVRRRKTAAEPEKLLCRGILTMFAISLLLPDYEWRLMMPLMPFILLLTAHVSTDDAGSGPWSDYALFATRSALMLMAALGAASPVALPALKILLERDIPLVVIPTCAVTGIAVLAIMLWDSYPGMPLCRLSGLSEKLNSSILGGTLITIGMISLIVPAFRNMREEEPFLSEVRKMIKVPPEAVVFIGDAKHAAALLFYHRMKSPITLIEVGDHDKFSRLVERRGGKEIAVISRGREEAGKELDFLRRCAEKHRLEMNVKPDLEEKLPPLGDPDRRKVFFLIRPRKNETSTVKGK